MRRVSLVGWLWRWHRRGGLLVALFVLFMTVSGIALNHAPDLGLNRHFLGWRWLRDFYGEQAVERIGFAVGARWFTRGASGVLFLDRQRVAPCEGTLVGAAASGDMFVAACAEELLLLTAEGELIESLGRSSGLPAPLRGLATAHGAVLLAAPAGWMVLDTDAMSLESFGGSAAGIAPFAPGTPPATLRRTLERSDGWLSWERLLLDLHSGRLFGRAGIYVVDAAGLLFAMLALSGVSMWLFHHRRRGRRE